MITPKKALRVGICGMGDWAWRHVKLLRETGGFELVAISSRSDAAWQRVGAELPGVHRYRDHRELLDGARPELVIVTTPHHLHAPMAIEALRAGAHVIVEKPMATSLADGKAMLAAARTAGKMLAVYHNRRFDPWLIAAQRVIEEGALGELIELNGSWPDNAPEGSWRRRKLESGGLFFDLGAHMVTRGLALATEDYGAEEASARRDRLGLWQGRFVDPKTWRDEGPSGDPGPGLLEAVWTWFRELTGARTLR